VHYSRDKPPSTCFSASGLIAMAHARHEQKITKRAVDNFNAESNRRVRLWDSELKGFCLQAYPTGRKVYVVGYSFGNRYRWITIGKHGDPWTPDSAREKAKSILGEIANGADPGAKKLEAREAASIKLMTVAQLIDRYLEEGPVDRPDKRSSSWANDKCYLNNHVRPRLGAIPVCDIRPRDISKFQDDVKRGANLKTAANKRGRKLSGG